MAFRGAIDVNVLIFIEFTIIKVFLFLENYMSLMWPLLNIEHKAIIKPGGDASKLIPIL